MMENDRIIYYQILSSMIEHFHPGNTFPLELWQKNQNGGAIRLGLKHMFFHLDIFQKSLAAQSKMVKSGLFVFKKSTNWYVSIL
jgi:hypothetical protein